jgi:hypothetical protein
MMLLRDGPGSADRTWSAIFLSNSFATQSYFHPKAYRIGRWPSCTHCADLRLAIERPTGRAVRLFGSPVQNIVRSNLQ